MPNFDEILTSFILLWAVIDPIGTVPVFLAVTRQHPDWEKNHVAIISILVAAGILSFFLVAGQLLLEAMHIPLAAFQVSGGIILFLFSLTMIFGQSKPEEEMQMARSKKETAIFPLAVPSIASPGAIMAIMLLTDNHRFSIAHQVVTGSVMLFILGITMVFLLFERFINKVLGDTGASIISRVMGLILSAVAANSVLIGVTAYIHQK